MQSSVPLPSSAAKSARPPASPRAPAIRLRWFALAFVLVLLGVAAWLVARELRTSELQARELSRIAREATFQVEDGPEPEHPLPDAAARTTSGSATRRSPTSSRASPRPASGSSGRRATPSA